MDYATFDKLCKENGTTATALALKLGLSKGNTTSWRRGGNPSAEILIRMADELNCTVDALLGRNYTAVLTSEENELIATFNKLNEKDRGKVIERAITLAEIAAEQVTEQAKKAATSTELVLDKQSMPNETYQQTLKKCNITYYDYPASAGTGLFLDETTSTELSIVQTPEALRANFAIPISGDSMAPDFSDGDIVLVKSCPCVSRGEIGIFLLDGEVFFKEFGGDQLISYNKKYKPIMLKPHTKSVCLGRVLGKAEIIK